MLFKSNNKLSQKIAALFAMWALLPIGSAFAAETNEDATDLANMEDMLITAERIPTNRWDTPANVAVITAKEIEDNHYQDLAEALSNVNGVYVGVGIYGNNIVTNGTNRAVLLVDGKRLSSPQVYDDYLSQSRWGDNRADTSPIPSIKMIERIEIIKGGNSALYGSDAVGGVVNIITKKGRRNETTIDINKAFGQSHRYGMEITNQGVNNRFSYFFTGNFRESRGHIGQRYGGDFLGIPFYTSDYVPQDSYNNKGLSLRMDYRLDDRSSLTIDGMYKQYNRLFEPNGRGKGLYNSVSFSYNFKENTSTPGWFRYHNNYSNPSTYGNLRLQAMEYQNGWALNNNNKLIVGFEWQKHKVQSRRFLYNGEINRGAIYLQDTMSIGHKWQVVPGVRLDYQETTGSKLSPKIAINYRPNEQTKFYSSWGRVYNAPSAIHLFAPDDAIFKGNSNLLPESGQAFTIGLEHAFNEKSNFSLNYFYNYVDNVIFSHYSDYIFDNCIQEKQHGFEVAFNQKLSDKWKFGIGYTHTDSERANTAQIWKQNSEYEIPTDSLVVGLNYRCGSWKANLTNMTYNFFHYLYNTSDNIKDRGISNWFDLNVSYDVDEQFTIYAKIKDVGNKKFNRTVNGYISQYAIPGRYFLLGATYKF